MRRLKAPGRIIGKEMHFYPQHFLAERGDHSFGNVDKPATDKHPAISKWLLTANFLRTIYDSPWKDDSKLQTRNREDTDIDGRGRDGLPVRPLELDEEYITQLTLVFHLQFAVGVKGDGSDTHEKRCMPGGRGFWGNN